MKVMNFLYLTDSFYKNWVVSHVEYGDILSGAWLAKERGIWGLYTIYSIENIGCYYESQLRRLMNCTFVHFVLSYKTIIGKHSEVKLTYIRRLIWLYTDIYSYVFTYKWVDIDNMHFILTTCTLDTHACLLIHALGASIHVHKSCISLHAPCMWTLTWCINQHI